jgi:hypothetical protein
VRQQREQHDAAEHDDHTRYGMVREEVQLDRQRVADRGG